MGHTMSAVFWNCFLWEAIPGSLQVREAALPGAVRMNRLCVLMKSSELCGFTFTVDADQVLFQLMDETYRETGWKLAHPDLPVLFIGGYEDPCIGGARKICPGSTDDAASRIYGYKRKIVSGYAS